MTQREVEAQEEIAKRVEPNEKVMLSHVAVTGSRFFRINKVW